MWQMSHLLSRHSSFHSLCTLSGRWEECLFVICSIIFFVLTFDTNYNSHIPAYSLAAAWTWNSISYKTLRTKHTRARATLPSSTMLNRGQFFTGDCYKSPGHFMINFGGKCVFCLYSFDEKEIFIINLEAPVHWQGPPLQWQCDSLFCQQSRRWANTRN